MRKVLFPLLAAVQLLTLAGCAANSGARLQRNQEAFDSFMGRKVLPGYRYYTIGPGETPDAIVGIRDGIRLSGGNWTERKMTTDLLDNLVRQMNDLYGAVKIGLAGSDIVGDDGERIGIWYSAIATTQVNMVSPTEVSITPPNPIFLDQQKVRLRG